MRREGERLIVAGKDGVKILFAHELEKIVLFGNVHMTAQARSLLLKRGIETLFLSSDGSYRGQLCGHEGENVFLRKKQYDLLNDEGFILRMARAIVMAKLNNQAIILNRLRREDHIDGAEHGINELRTLINEAREEKTVDSLRGIEGSGANAYFKYFAGAFHSDWGFEKRVRRPPTDPVNAVLSLLYTLLADRCAAACRIAGLDPYPANLHALEYGRQSLPLDLVEEFRAFVADMETVALFNTRQLKNDDFSRDQDDEDSTGAVTLRKEALGKVLGAFAKKLATGFAHPETGEMITYAKAITEQARIYREAVEGKIAVYTPIVWHK